MTTAETMAAILAATPDPKVGTELMLDTMYFRQADFHPGCGHLYMLSKIGDSEYGGKWSCKIVKDDGFHTDDIGSVWHADEICDKVQSGIWRIV